MLNGWIIVASIAIRNLDDAFWQRLWVCAAEHGHSIEEGVREILRDAVGTGAPPVNLTTAIRVHVAGSGGVELDRSLRKPPRFDRLQ